MYAIRSYYGGFLGVFGFAELYPLVKGLYMAEYQGNLLVFEMMDISREQFGIILVLVASGVFVATQVIENKVNHKETLWLKSTIIKNSLIVLLPLALIVLVMITPTPYELMNKRIDEKIAAGQCKPEMIDGDKLAYELVNNYYLYNVIDVRTPQEYKAFHIPTAINIPLAELHLHHNHQLFIQNIIV